MKENRHTPPRPPLWAEWLLERLAAPHLREEVQGDLEERFGKHLQRHGPAKARRRFVLDLLTLLHPRLWRRKPDPYASHQPTRNFYPAMLSHHLLLTYRTFLRFKGSFFINLIGLSTGLACALLIYLWVNDELLMDKFHAHDRRLYQVMKSESFMKGADAFEWQAGPLAEALAREMPEVEKAVSYREGGNQVILSAGNTYAKAKEVYAGKDFFTLFSYPLLQGNAGQVLQDENAVVLSEELARKLFGTTGDAIGKRVVYNQGEMNGTYPVSGVFKKLPAHATAQFDLVLPFDLYAKKNTWAREWFNNACYTYLLLKEEVDPTAFSTKLSGFLRQKTSKEEAALLMRPYSDKYLYGTYENGRQAGGRIEYVRLFSLLAAFILCIACVNFMNLSTAKAARRLKEIGIKKVIGVGRKSLIGQFLCESLLLAFIAMLVALLLTALYLPVFTQITGKSLRLQVAPALLLAALGITLFTGLFAGSYPALYLSGFRPLAVLKGGFIAATGEVWVRKGLVVFQFTVSVILIVSVLVVYRQVDYIQFKHLGYDRDHVVTFQPAGQTKRRSETLIGEVKRLPGVVNASGTGGNLTSANNYTSDVSWAGKDPEANITVAGLHISYDFIETLGMQLKEGRSFSRAFGLDSTKIILNEAAVALMGFKEPVGKMVKLWGKDMLIIGVVRNFHFESLYEPLKPCFLVLRTEPDRIMVRVEQGRERETLKRLGELYRKFSAGIPFEYRFLNQEYQALYIAEQRVAVLSRYFAGIAILISCLGLLGLAAFTAERRRKEIGIRKVLGASEAGIVYLLSNDFTRLVGTAIGVGLPVSYGLANAWLKGFAYRIDLEPWYFLLAGLLALGTALLTVSLQAFKAARIHPVQCLKEE